MEIVDATQINSFAPVAQQADVSPEEPIFVTIPATALQDLLGAIQSLKDTIALQGEKIVTLESTQDLQAENELNMLRLIADLRLRHKEPGKTEISRAEKIEKYLQSRPDHRASFETLKGHLGIDNDRLGKVIRVLVSSGKCIIVRTPGDKRKRALILLPR
jgi:hypothetical protein